MLKALKVNILIIFVSVLISLYLCETYLTFKQNQKSLEYKAKVYKKKTGLDFDLRSILEVFEDEKKINEKVALRYLPKILLNKNITLSNKGLFPLSGISNMKTILCNEEGYYSSYTSDRYGFNNPNEVWDNSNVNAILIGDSFTHGDCVNRPNDISSVIRDGTNTNVINLGYRGNGPLIEYATLREYFVKDTKNIIWIYYENDLNDLKNELNNQFLQNYLIDKDFSQNLIDRQNEINEANEELINNLYSMEVKTLKQNKKNMDRKNKILKFIRFDSLKRFIKNYYNKKDLNNNKLPVEYFYEILSDVKNFADKNNSNFYFIYLPEIKNFQNKNFDNKNLKLVKDITNDLGIKFIDLNDELFNNFKNPVELYTFKLGPHLNENGYREVALKIIELTELK